jgi:hypothetical protein
MNCDNLRITAPEGASANSPALQRRDGIEAERVPEGRLNPSVEIPGAPFLAPFARSGAFPHDETRSSSNHCHPYLSTVCHSDFLLLVIPTEGRNLHSAGSVTNHGCPTFAFFAKVGFDELNNCCRATLGLLFRLSTVCHSDSLLFVIPTGGRNLHFACSAS